MRPGEASEHPSPLPFPPRETGPGASRPNVRLLPPAASTLVHACRCWWCWEAEERKVERTLAPPGSNGKDIPMGKTFRDKNNNYGMGGHIRGRLTCTDGASGRNQIGGGPSLTRGSHHLLSLSALGVPGALGWWAGPGQAPCPQRRTLVPSLRLGSREVWTRVQCGAGGEGRTARSPLGRGCGEEGRREWARSGATAGACWGRRA